MDGLIIFFITTVVLYCSITWLLPTLLSWFIKRKYRLEAQIGRISIPYFVLHDILIKKNGFSVHIDKIGFRSSFLSSEVSKLLCLVICDVRVNKDVTSGTSNNIESQVKDVFCLKDVSFHDQKIPPVVITFAQFLAIHIRSITAMFLRPESPEWLLHASATDVQLDGSLVRSARTLLVNVTMISASAKLLRHAPTGTKPGKPITSQFATCLAELSVSLSAELTLLAQGPFSIEKLCIAVESMKSVINEGFYGFVQQRYQNIRGMSQNTVSSEKINDVAQVYQLIYNVAPIIPKIALIKIEKSILTGMKDSINTEINASLRKFQIKTYFESTGIAYQEFNEESVWPNFAIDIVLIGLDICGNKDKIVNLQEFKLDSKLEKKCIILKTSVSTFSLLYNHKDIVSWWTTNFGYLSSIAKAKETSLAVKNEISRKKCWMDYFSLEMSAELFSITALMRLSSDFLLGFNSIKFLLNCDNVVSEENFEFFNGNNLYRKLPLNLYKRSWACEFLMDSVWADLNYDHGVTGTPLFKKYHYWGTPFYLGATLVKMKGCLLPKTPRLQVMLDTVRLEWSPPLASFIQQVHNCCNDYPFLSKNTLENGYETKMIKANNSSIICNITISCVNVFFIAERKVCIMVRIDTIMYGSDVSKMFVSFEGVKIASIIPTKHHFVCVKSDDLKNACVFLKSGQFEYKNNSQKFELTEEIDFVWSTNFHLKLLTLYSNISETFHRIFGSKGRLSSGSDQEKSDVSPIIKVSLKGRFRLGVKMSKKRQILFTTECITFRKVSEQIRMECSAFKIAVDNHNIFSFEGFRLVRLINSQMLRAKRANAEGFILPVNTTWEVNISSFKAVFPYEHNFSDTFHGEFLSIVKWLRLLHKRPNKNTIQNLPGDIILKIKELVFEMSDDPFEVSLRDNYELLVDEYWESQKRKDMLEEKIDELYPDRLKIPAEKYEEVYAKLQREEAGIYIKRSKQMRLQAPVRTRLFAWLISDLEVNLMSDPSIVGPENVVKIMTEIDTKSPWPEEGLEFTTLWCRFVVASCREWKFQLRDFPLPWLEINELNLWGRLVGAEQEATKRAKRDVVIQLGEPYGEVTIERSMTSLKYYHDFYCQAEHLSYAFGPCWEPVISQCNLAFSQIVSSSKDPSPPLPFWDKIRLIYHGRLTMYVRQLTFLLHASLDPYNTTEEMEVTWSNLEMDWTNAKFIFKGNLEVYVRTASKYDDCCMLDLPNLKLTMELEWICLGEPNDHHSVMPCAADKVPEYSSNQEHDSFRAFRSQNVNLTFRLETKPPSNLLRASKCPMALLFNSTLRWFENLKLILSGVTRPTRRGAIFKNQRPRKLSLSRHYKKVYLSLALHRFQVHYWMSFSKQRGLELGGQKFTFSSEYSLALLSVEDYLRHRPRAVWSITYMNCELNDAEVWLKSALQVGDKKEITLNFQQPVEKCYFLSVAKVSYGRETSMPNPVSPYTGSRSVSRDDTPTHKLVVLLLKGAWTPSNRDIILALYDSFRKTQQLKKNLSTAALKGFRCPESSTPIKTRSRSIENQVPPGSPIQASNNTIVMQETPSPLTKLQSGHAASMLQQLIAEAENKAVVFSDDLSVQMREEHLQGLAACQEDDVVHKNWLIALINSQVLLKGCETKGYVIVSAAKAEVLKKIHRPVWKDRTLVSKTSWVGTLECMQYYATVSANDTLDENIMWLSVENIQEKDADSTIIADLPDLPHLVGSGQSVGGVVSETVGAGNVNENMPLQLQRIVSRCKCEFFYAGYGETSLDPSILDEVPPPPAEESGTPWERQDKAIDAFTLMHHDLDVSTNSLQYGMILDIVNNLLLYVEPRRKEAYERLQRMRFQLQLQSVRDQRKPIQKLQNLVRCLAAKLRRLEKEIYLVHRTMVEEGETEELKIEKEKLQNQINECKEQLNSNSEELDMMLSCYKETQLMANQKLELLRGDKPITAVRKSEICFKHAQWRLTETDGQLGIADLVLSNFLYTKVSKSDDSVEHLLELGYIRVTNLLANEVYREVIVPTEIQKNMPVARQRAVRIFCREKAPVGGISVKEHFEINVVPFTIGLTKKFYDTMMKFCFPERDTDNIEGDGSEDTESLSSGISNSSKKNKFCSSNEKFKKGKETNFYVPIVKDDVEKMKERAEKNKLFIYIKIPEVPVRVSYKGNKEKNLEDIRDFSLVIPTLEYHNVTWTWLDLILAMKNDSRRVIVPQAIKQKLQIKMRTGSVEEGSSPQEEDKARLLLGSHIMLNESKGVKRIGILKLPK